MRDVGERRCIEKPKRSKSLHVMINESISPGFGWIKSVGTGVSS